MIIIDVIITRASNKLLLWIQKLESCESCDCCTARKRKSFIAIWRRKQRGCVSGWKLAGMRAGLRLLAELQFELWVGDAAEIRTKRVRKQKTDRQDAQLILRLLIEDRFPQIWVASWENRDLRQLLWHRHRIVQARTRTVLQLEHASVG